LSNNLLPHFTDHSIDHSDHVALLVDEFVRPIQQAEQALNDRELMPLYASCYMHDIGMQFENAGNTVVIQQLELDLPWHELQEATRRELLRLHHHEISAEMVILSAQGLRPLVGVQLTAEYGPDYVAALCEAHALDVDTERYRTLTQEGPGVRMALLSGVLRMADVLDESRRRASRLRANTLALDPGAQLHWWRHYYVEDVSFDPVERSITLWFDFPTDRRVEYGRIVPRLQLPSISAELARHQIQFARAGLAWVAKTKVAEKAYSSAETMPDDVLVSMLKEIGQGQEDKRHERTRLSLDTLDEARPYIMRRLDEVESQRETLGPAEYVRERFRLASQLWDLGGRRSAWMAVWHDYGRDSAALPPSQRLLAGMQLADMMERDESADKGARVLQQLEAISALPEISPEDRFRFWELNARCLIGIGEMDSAVIAIEHAKSIAPDPEARAVLDAMLAEYYLLQREIDKALEAATAS
jgi:hypothetical protein